VSLVFDRMLRGLINLVLGRRSARIEPMPLLASFGEYSAFSGIVCYVELGEPAQEIKLGLDFSSTVTGVFSNHNGCPPFVGPCFDAAISTQSVEDTSIRINEVNLGRVHLQYISSRNSVSEVAGFLGASPHSPIFAGKYIRLEEISSSSAGPLFSEIQRDRLPPRESVHRVVTGSTKWTIQGTLRFGRSRDTRIELVEFNPNEEDLVLPSSYEQMVLSLAAGGQLTIDSSNRLAGPCSDPALSVELILGLPMNARVTVNSDALIKDRDSDRCKFRIRFKRNIRESAVRIGRLLTRSVGRLTLDYRNKAIRISDLESRVANVLSGHFESMRPLVPVFEPLRYYGPVGHESGNIMFRASQEILPNSLVYVSETAGFVQYGVLTGTGHIFRRLRPDPTITGTRISMLRSACTLGDRRIGGRQYLSFSVDNYGDYDVWLVSTSDEMVLLKTHFPRSLDIPPPAPRTDPIDLDCGICLDAMRQGDMEQELRPCGHKFHSECISRWLKKDRSCPFCRTPIPTVV
jgi:hypothetical protein